jgi:hypothetical protein
MKFVTVLFFALMMSLMVASSSFATEEKGSMGDNTPDYKAVPKAMHEKAFPSGHPVTERWSNHCYYDQKEELYFCSDTIWQ